MQEIFMAPRNSTLPTLPAGLCSNSFHSSPQRTIARLEYRKYMNLPRRQAAEQASAFRSPWGEDSSRGDAETRRRACARESAMFCATGAMSGLCSAAPRLRVISLFLDVRGLACMVTQGTLQRLRVFICFCRSLRQDLRGAWVQGRFMSF